MAQPVAHVVESRLVRGYAGQPDHWVVTVECPHCGKRHTHGWVGHNTTRVPHCAQQYYPEYRLEWADAPATAN